MEKYSKLKSKPVIEHPKESWEVIVSSGSKIKAVISKAIKLLQVCCSFVILIHYSIFRYKFLYIFMVDGIRTSFMRFLSVKRLTILTKN